ncbi:S-formylglutathione hydrolase [Celerinatantimonas yamalensis]|uniref:S-formylglutathione hydrolase n=1 Tax=Celerinatantimonas yamalensis TaxID=559956 RepID=A0ABW9G983_9GAMM
MNELIESRRCFNGEQRRYRHRANTLSCDMQVSVYLPDQAKSQPLPAVYWLSGLTCNDRNFVEKAGAQRIASELGLILIVPDTSPRGEGVADADSDSLGQGAGFYVNATEQPWRAHYQMERYVTDELVQWSADTLPVNDKRAIAGHSMGGHGALTLALKHPHLYTSASAFSPISHPTECPWGQAALSAYLGEDPQLWLQHDACVLLQSKRSHIPMRVDQGLADPFLTEQLNPQALEKAAQVHQAPLAMHYHDGFDHSYFFVASFIETQLRFHHHYLR